MLPPSLFPYEPLDTMDQRYLDLSHAPIVSPLKQALDIELYNDTYFPSKSKHIIDSSTDQVSCSIDESALQEHYSNVKIPSRQDLFESCNDDAIPDVESVQSTVLDPLLTSIDLSNKLFLSNIHQNTPYVVVGT